MDYSKMLRFHLERERGCDAGGDRGAAGRRATASASSAIDRVRPRDRLRREAGTSNAGARLTRRRARLDGDLHLQGGRARAGARGRRDPRRQPARFRARTSSPRCSARRRSTRTASTTRTRRRRSTGATSARSTRTSKRAWTCATSIRSSICTIRSGRCGPISRRRRRRSSSSPKKGRRCGQALDSVISNGCIISGSRVSRQHPLSERARPQLL